MRFIWKEPATWRPLLDRTSRRRQTPATVLRAVRQLYADLQVFHAGRPMDVDPYYREGLQPANHKTLTAVARRIFLSGEFPELDESQFQTALSRLSGIDDARLYTSLDDRLCISDCGHYLIYGSEHICGIAAGLSRNRVRDYRQVLKRFGRPTIFRLSLPMSLASDSDLLEFAQLLLQSLRRVGAGQLPPKVDFTFTLRRSLPGECVLGHEHPASVKDPLLPMQPWYHYAPPV